MIIQNFDTNERALLIAEIGNNHEGSSELALELVTAAAEAGADAVKVQIINPERLVNRLETERIAQLSHFRLPLSTFVDMASLARSKGLLFMASVFDLQSLEDMAEMLAAVKIASGDIDFWPLLVKAATLHKPIVLSTGMSTLPEVKMAVDIIARHLPTGRPLADILALLHCVSLYPTQLNEANLRVIKTLHETFHLTIGYSDHTLGIETAIVSLTLGARIIEKHFTLDKTRTSFRDHAMSADPDDMRRLAAIMHNFDKILGSGEKRLSVAEAQAASALRRSIVAARDLAAGTHLTIDDLEYVRPRKGLPPSQATTIVGRKLRVPLRANEFILERHLE
jgi:N,N'-diacetyllegionaminate synthase